MGKRKKALVRDFKKMDITKFKEDLSKSVIADNGTGRYGMAILKMVYLYIMRQ